MSEADVLHQTQQFVTSALSKIQTSPGKIPLIQETESLVNTVQEIAGEMQLSKKRKKIVILATWLHALEGSTNISSGDEALSGNILSSQGVSLEESQQIMGCLQAATPSVSPATLTEEIFCDALTAYIARAEYPEHIQRLKRELETTLGKPLSEAVWIRDILDFFRQHQFYTSFARQKYGPGKEKNFQYFTHKLTELNLQDQQAIPVDQPKVKSKKDKKKEQKPARGIETMFRTTIASHLQLSVMADNKASLMISINAIIVSIILSSFLRNFEEMPHLVIPTVLLTAVCLGTIVFAVLSTKPRLKLKKKGLAKAGKLDLLFFGDFAAIPLDSYRKSIQEMMIDPDRLYNGMIDNIYAQGQVIAKKYRLLTIAYIIFMIGFIMAVLSYLVALLVQTSQ